MSGWTSERLRERAEQVLNGAGMDPVALTAGANLMIASELVRDSEPETALRQVHEDQVRVADPEPPFAGEFGDGGGSQGSAEAAPAVATGGPEEPPATREETPQF